MLMRGLAYITQHSARPGGIARSNGEWGIHMERERPLLRSTTMDIKKEKKVIQGEATKDLTYSSEHAFSDVLEATKEFHRSVNKLFDVDRWTDLPGISARFELHDAQGRRKTASEPTVGDHIKILLPGPFPENWVNVTDMQIGNESAQFTVSPSHDPNAQGQERKEIKHFFSDGATSTFKVERVKNILRAYEIGRNEGINNQGEEAGDRKIMNTLIAEGGWLIFQKVQWEKLTNYLVHNVEIEGE